MKTYRNDETIEVLGVSFNGVKEMIELARSGTPKEGVYVAVDRECYPCFDAYDSMYEDRCFTNIVFATRAEELAGKMAVLKEEMRGGANYNKLTAKLHPMAYWQGDKCHDVFLTEADDARLLLDGPH